MLIKLIQQNRNREYENKRRVARTELLFNFHAVHTGIQ